MQAEKVIQFWFQELSQTRWWQKDLQLDEMIRKRFHHYHRAAIHCELYLWRQSALGRLAEVIILDQFSRNIYRDQAQAFAADSLALGLSQEAISQGIDQELLPQQRAFFYMPYMHSESMVIHEQAVKLYQQLGIEDNLRFELAHKKIIDRFGRYPHRNKILGRLSTQEEILFLTEPGSSF